MTTIRMRRCGMDRTLDGYVFSDMAHARQWLSQGFVRRAEIQLEEVTVEPPKRCPRCDGAGHLDVVRFLRKLTPQEIADI